VSDLPRATLFPRAVEEDVRWGRAERLELKYCVPDPVAAAVLEVARLFLRPERGLPAGTGQMITSLYLDTPGLTFMQRHLEDAPDRLKLRVRAYGPPPWPTVYAEIKQKRGGFSRKRRAEINASHLRDVLDGCDLGFAKDLRRDSIRALEEFVWQRLTHNAAPKVLLRTCRESLRGGCGDQTAVTVDRAISYQPTGRFDLEANPDAWRPLSLPQNAGPATVVLELKHASRPPAWMKAVTAALVRWRVSFSKYVTAMTQLHKWEARP
jgi:hypothetical protein